MAENNTNTKTKGELWLESFLNSIRQYKALLSIGFLLAFISAIVGFAYSWGVALGEKIALEEIDTLKKRVEVLEQTTKDILIVNEAMAYIPFKNNVEALEKLEELINQNPNKDIKFLALENKARILIRQGGGTFDSKVLELSEDMIKKYPKRYNGYHWRGLSRLRITMQRYENKIGNLPLDTLALRKALMDFDSSIYFFGAQIKDRINKVETLIILNEYELAQREILEAKGQVDLKQDFHVLILDYLNEICKVLRNEKDVAGIEKILDRIDSLPERSNFNYTSKELKIAFDNSSFDKEIMNDLDKLMKKIEKADDPEVGF